MDGSGNIVEADDGFHQVGGDLIFAEELQSTLARSLFRFVSEYGGHTVQVEGLRQIVGGIQVLILNLSTCVSQTPKYDVLAEERLAVFFIDDEPAVVPLRVDFPLTPHSYGLPAETVLPGMMSICIDDRPWEDARADYSGAEIIRRIISWFSRVDTGKIDDALQLPHTIFLPAEQTIIMSPDIQSRFNSKAGPPVFLRIRALGEDEKLFEVEDYELSEQRSDDSPGLPPFIGFTLGVRAKNGGAMWHRPGSLGDLRYALSGADEDLLEVLRAKLSELMTDAGEHIERLYQSHLLIQFVVVNDGSDNIEPMFLGTEATLGEIGIALGLLHEAPGEVGHSYGRLLVAVGVDAERAEGIRLMAANLSYSFEGEVAALYAGHGSHWRGSIGKNAAVLGAGSIGSQCLTALVREGAFDAVTIVDDDHFAPHNLARHTLRSSALGLSKAEQFAGELREMRPDLAVTAIGEKVRSSELSAPIARALHNADLILDMTASVGASRLLCEIGDRPRAVAAFFNPTGTSVVILQEDDQRNLDLATLEALYYAEIVHQAPLKEHLRPGDQAVVSGGQCRSVTNRIPASRAAVLSGIAASLSAESLQSSDSAIMIATISDTGATDVHRFVPIGRRKVLEADGWTIGLADTVEQQLQDIRKECLPNETGGILLGVVDNSRKRIEVAIGLQAPRDSTGTPISFERGVQGTVESIANARAQTMHQLTYIGEWHSHPKGARATPSLMDAHQLTCLKDELATEQRPPVMVIVGDSGSNPISIGSHS